MHERLSKLLVYEISGTSKDGVLNRVIRVPWAHEWHDSRLRWRLAVL